MRSSQDGFVIAEKDLEMRGPGEVLGVRQSGLMQFKMADILRDKDVLNAVVKWEKDGMEFSAQEKSQLIHRWLKKAEQFAEV